jgi:hypothetical protein
MNRAGTACTCNKLPMLHEENFTSYFGVALVLPSCRKNTDWMCLKTKCRRVVVKTRSYCKAATAWTSVQLPALLQLVYRCRLVQLHDNYCICIKNYQSAILWIIQLRKLISRVLSLWNAGYHWVQNRSSSRLLCKHVKPKTHKTLF